MARTFDDAAIERLLRQGLSINKTADTLGISRTSLKRYLHERRDLDGTSQVNPSPLASTSTSALAVYPSQLPSTTLQDSAQAAELYQLLPVLREIAREWMEHRQSLQVNLSQLKSTVRWTYHLDVRFVQAVKEYAQLHRLPESAVVNLALQQFFQSRQGE
jgi:transposase-like protein